MQPTYLPWVGYLDLIDQADAFVFLDTAEFSRQSWQQRNRIRTARGLEWLTVPVLHKGRARQNILEVDINPNVDFPRSHLRALQLSYSRAPHFAAHFGELTSLIEAGAETGLLCELNLSIIRWLCASLGIETETFRSSGLTARGLRSSLLIDICSELGADVYLSTAGSLDYLREDAELFTEAGLPVLIREYIHPQYSQVYAPFLPFAAAIDVLFNEGPGARELIRAGRRPPISLAAALAAHLGTGTERVEARVEASHN